MNKKENKFENFSKAINKIVGDTDFDSAFLLLRKDSAITAIPSPDLTPMEIYGELRSGIMSAYEEIILVNTLIIMKKMNEDMFNAVIKDAKEVFPNFDRVMERVNNFYNNEEKVS